MQNRTYQIPKKDPQLQRRLPTTLLSHSHRRRQQGSTSIGHPENKSIDHWVIQINSQKNDGGGWFAVFCRKMVGRETAEICSGYGPLLPIMIDCRLPQVQVNSHGKPPVNEKYQPFSRMKTALLAANTESPKGLFKNCQNKYWWEPVSNSPIKNHDSIIKQVWFPITWPKLSECRLAFGLRGRASATGKDGDEAGDQTDGLLERCAHKLYIFRFTRFMVTPLDECAFCCLLQIWGYRFF